MKTTEIKSIGARPKTVPSVWVRVAVYWARVVPLNSVVGFGIAPSTYRYLLRTPSCNRTTRPPRTSFCGRRHDHSTSSQYSCNGRGAIEQLTSNPGRVAKTSSCVFSIRWWLLSERCCTKNECDSPFAFGVSLSVSAATTCYR